MPRIELSLSPEARKALIDCNTQSGALPQGTTESVIAELREAGCVSRTAMTISGRAARGRLLHDLLEEL